jgi:hypothetical protein
MSAVLPMPILPTPALPTHINLEDIKAYIDSEIQKGIEKAVIPLKAKISYLETELEKVKFGLDDNKELLAISLKRNTQLEHALFLHDSEGEILRDFDNQPVLNATLSNEKPLNTKTNELPIIPQTSLELKACAIKDHLLENVKPRKAGVYMNSKEFHYFMKNTISADLRWKQDIGNPRQAKKDIIEKAIKLYPDILTITKSLSKNRVTGIELKSSVKRPDTYTQS